MSWIKLKNVSIGVFRTYLNCFSRSQKLLVFHFSNIAFQLNIDDIKKSNLKDEKATKGSFPKISKHGFIRLLLNYFPGFTIYLRDIEITITSKFCNDILRIKLEQVKINTEFHKNRGTLGDSGWLIHHYFLISNLQVKSSKPNSETVDLFKNFVINLDYFYSQKDLKISNINANFANQSLELPIYTFLALIIDFIPKSNIQSDSPMLFSHPSYESVTEKGKQADFMISDKLNDFIDHLTHKLQAITDSCDLFNELNITLSNICIDQFYLFFLFLEKKHYSKVFKMLDDDDMCLLTQIYFQLRLQKFTIGFNKLSKESPGYELSFAINDSPVQFISSLMKLQLIMFYKFNGDEKRLELFQVPNINFSVQTNAAIQTLKVLLKSKKMTSAVVKASSHASSPTFELNSFYLGVLLRNTKQIKCICESFINSKEQKKAPISKNDSIIKYFYSSISKFLPQIFFKVTIEDTILLVKFIDSENGIMRTVSLNMNFISFEINSKKKSFHHNSQIIQSSLFSKFEISGIRVSYQQRCVRTDDEDLVVVLDATDDEMDSNFDFVNLSEEIGLVEYLVLKVSLEDLKNMKLSTFCSIETIFIDLSNMVVLKGLSEILNNMHATHNHYNHFNKEMLAKYTRLCVQLGNRGFFASLRDDEFPKQKELSKSYFFQPLPEYLKEIKILVTDCNCILGSRSVLIPKEVINELKFVSENETIKNSLRKIVFELDSWSLSLVNAPKVAGDERRPSRSTSDTLNSSSVEMSSILGQHESDSDDENLSAKTGSVDNYWNMQMKAQNIGVDIICCDPRNFQRNRDKTAEDKSSMNKKNYNLMNIRCLKIPKVKGILSSVCNVSEVSTNDYLKLVVEIEEIDFIFSGFSHFIFISSISLVRNTIFSYLNHFPKPKKVQKSSFVSKLSDLLVTEINVKTFDMIIHFPLDLKMKIQSLDTLIKFDSRFKESNITASIFRICVQSPTIRNYWERLLIINAFDCDLDLKNLKEFNRLRVEGESNLGMNELLVGAVNFLSARLTIPFNFIIHRIFDNFGILKKIVKQLNYSFKKNSPENILNPEFCTPSVLPKIKISTQKFLMNMDDDPFESQLAYICQIGLSEQRERMSKLEYFVQNVKARKFINKEYTIKKTSCFGLEVSDSENIFGYDSGKLWRKSKCDDSKQVSYHDQHLKETFSKLEILQRNFSKSWVNRVQTYRQKFNKEIRKNSEYLWRLVTSESLSKKFNKRIWEGFFLGPPLMSVIVEDVDLTLSSVDFDMSELPQYLYGVGKGIPLDSQYQMMIPLHIDFKFGEFRSHLRDYPLPFVYIPFSKEGISHRITGNVVISEEFVHQKENINMVFAPLVPSCEKADSDPYYSLSIPKTLASVKTFMNLNIEVNSHKSTRFTWGSSYQPAIQQVMLNFDGFTKPPLDPSDKVGFWDKLRANIHGRVNFKLNALDIVFKGSRDPYKMLNPDAGFMLSFSDNVVLDVNKDDNPKEFIVVTSNKIRWVAPNLISEPLLIWSRSSKDSVFLPASRDLNINNLSGFYLSDDGTTEFGSNINDVIQEFYEKIVINLSADSTNPVMFKCGVMFERNTYDGSGRTDQFVPHYTVQLKNPKFVKDPNYDAYKGFRSHYIHMALSLTSLDGQGKCYNSVHLSPNVFSSFFKWWKLFSGNMSLPVRHGKIFGPTKASKKFSVYLSTIKYQFLLSPVYACHVYSDELNNNNVHDGDLDSSQSVGLKGKFDTLKIDLHQRKQQTVIHREILNTTKKTMKMKFNIGEIDLEGVDVRIVNAIFSSKEHTDNKDKVNMKTFDDDSSWFDLNDFEELGFPSIKGLNPSIRVSPLMFAPRMMYFRQLKESECESEVPFGNEPSHDCVLSKKNSSIEAQIELTKTRIEELKKQSLNNHKDGHNLENILEEVAKNYEVLLSIKNGTDDSSTSEAIRKIVMLQNTGDEVAFNNRFIIHNMLLKWNCNNRDFLYKYFHWLKYHKAISHYMTNDAISSMSEIIDNKLFDPSAASLASSKSFGFKNTLTKQVSTDIGYCEKSLGSFDEDIRYVSSSNLFYNDDYLIKLVSPQIQLIDEDSNDACMLVVAPSIEMKVISINQKRLKSAGDDSETLEYSDVVETRIGSLIHEANIFAFYKEDVVENSSLYFSTNSYGTKNSNWPPWLGVELCTNGTILKDNMMLEKTSMMLRYDTIGNTLKAESEEDPEKRRNSITFNVPQVIINCDSRQYTTMYSLVWDLLIYSEPSLKEMSSKLEKLAMKISLDNASDLLKKVRQIQKDINILDNLEKSFTTRSNLLNNEEKKQLSLVKSEKSELLEDLYTSMQTIALGGSQNKNIGDQVEWSIRADSIICHMLLAKRKPFIDVALSNSRFKRRENSDMSNENILQIGMIQGFNLAADTYYQEMLTPFYEASTAAPKESVQKPEDLITIKWSMRKPVGGIKILKYFYIFLQPIKLQLDQETGSQILEYIFQNEKLKWDTNKKSPIKRNPGKGDEASTEVDFDDFSSDSEESLSDELKVNKRSKKSSFSSLRTKNDGNNQNLLNPFQKTYRNTSQGSLNLSNYERSINSNIDREDKDVDEMMERAGNNMNIESFKLDSCVLCISYKGEGKQKIVSVNNFVIKLPNVIIQQRILSLFEISMFLKKVVIKSLLQHSGKLIKNKLKYNHMEKIKQPLMQLTQYNRFVSIQELKGERVGVENERKDGEEAKENGEVNR
ncbi:Fmp27 protein [Saccharomycopsis crataegensis]|uniref:Fmp27 protein n=1 Tax=Saccharomycopsis crataegensis TaxID=43959 RepID=A0AAV5QIP8_9ASCO|nr:Fmp27 protein [Saccharomycopsis crataegensis]